MTTRKSDRLSFNFGANIKAKKTSRKAKKSGGKKRSGSGKGNAWRAYIGGSISNAPIPD